MKKKLSIPFEILLLFIAVLAFYQIAFLLNSVKWDMVVGYLPRRYFIGECLQNGIFPLWNPYGEGGYPIYANLISTWSPLNMFTGALTGYTNLTLHFFFIVHVYMAGLGMFKLINHLVRHRKIAFIIGIAYMLSGIFIGNAQHINILSGSSWLPWVMLFYYRFYKDSKIVNILWCCIFLFLMVTDGYPAITIITGYVLFILFIGFSVKKWKNYGLPALINWIGANGILAIIIISLSIGQILALKEVAPYISRFNQVDALRAFNNPFSIPSLLSFLFPYATVNDYWLFKTDTSMANAYLGLLPLATIFSGIFLKLPKKAWAFLIIAVVALTIAVGDALPFRALTYEYLPMMDKFRYPSLFRVFSVFAFLVFAGFSFKALLNQKHRIKHLKFVLSALVILIFGTGIFAATKIDFNVFSLFNNAAKSTVYDRIFTQSLIQLIILALLIFTFSKKQINWKLIILILFTDLFLAVQLNMHSTGVSNKNPIEWYKQIKKHPEGFPVPSRKPLIKQTNKLFSFGPSWKNGSIFRKEISLEGYNPFLLNTYKKLDRSKKIRQNTLQNPIVYFADSIITYAEAENITLKPNILVVEEHSLQRFVNTDFKTDYSYTWQITSFSPTKINIVTETSNPQLLVLQQANYPGWQATIDGNSVEHFIVNHHFMAIVLPSGKHKVTFMFEKNYVITASLISLTVFIILVILAIVISLRKQKLIVKTGITAAIIVISLIAVYNYFNRPYNHTRNQFYKKAAAQIKSWNKGHNQKDFSYIFPVDNPSLIKAHLDDSTKVVFSRIYTEQDISELENNVHLSEKNNMIYFWSNTVNEESLKAWLYFHYPKVKKIRNYEHGQLAWLTRSIKHKTPKVLHINYEKGSLFWNKHKSNVDSINTFEGNYAFKIGTKQKYGGGFELQLGKHFNEKHEFIAIKGVNHITQKAEGRAVLRFFSKNAKKPIKTRSIRLLNADTTRWYTHYIATKIPRACSKIHFFYYKPNKTSGVLSVDDCNVLFIEDDFLKCGSIEK
ncbi:putative membrane protein [Salinivirga cyanobacteriivorans]|uniref:Putative membrane protein n=1 Tax=Salinivirga cyanobacteriivorans TaxID=1307839 RepID=A0A0S2I3Q7_9BACT|nr:YfhO family protein [Salinivirga cyanobacteriivorans]ALO17081.1 putative membrane protein [Salinivirga cyanobacteriivorans]